MLRNGGFKMETKEQNTEEMDVMKQFMELLGLKSEQQKKEPEKPKTKSQEASL